MQCQATTKNGLPCRLKAIDGEDFCHIHMPKFCKYCGTEMEGEYCHECGGSDKIEPDFEKPDELPVKSDKTIYTNALVWLADHMNGETAKSVKQIVEELCDECGKWFKESDLKDGLCKNCNPPSQFITSLDHAQAGIIERSKQKSVIYASEPVSNYVTCKKCQKVIDNYAIDEKGYCNSCHNFRDSEPIPKSMLVKCKICGHSIISGKSKEEGYCHRCYEIYFIKKTQINPYSSETHSYIDSDESFTNLCAFLVGFILIGLTIVGFVI